MPPPNPAPARHSSDYTPGSPNRLTHLPAKSVAHAMQLAGIVHGDGGPADVAALLADMSRDELNALAVTLAAMVDVDKTPGELLSWNDGPPKPLSSEGDARRFIIDVADFYAVTVGEVLSRDKTTKLVRARQLAMWLCHHEANLGLSAVGRLFDRDHTTVLHAVRRVDLLLANGALHRERLAFPLENAA